MLALSRFRPRIQTLCIPRTPIYQALSKRTMAKHSRSPSQDDASSKPSPNKRSKQSKTTEAAGDPGLKHPSVARAKEIDASPPIDELTSLLSDQKTDHPVRNVLHWFRSKDLRQEDNRALHAASEKAKESKDGVLLTMYLYSPRDMEWHGTSPARSDFLMESLRILRDQLHEKNIPLALVEVQERAQKTDAVLKFIRDNDISHVYGNFEYEIDELRRDIKVSKHVAKEEDKVSFELFHDQTVITPGEVQTGTGSPAKVFTPYHKSWIAEVARNPGLLDLVPSPEENDKKAVEKYKKLFEGDLPDLPENKQFEDDEKKSRIRKLWPPGHDAGMKRLENFLKSKIKNYAETRSDPSEDSTSRLSPYFASGVVSVREVLAKTKEFNKSNKNFSSGEPGVAAWVREIVFREFYRQMICIVPHNAMNLPQNLRFDSVEWEDDEEGWHKWCVGQTGIPLVDAGMRQLNHEAWMHNRARMNVSNYLYTTLLIDYRRGERYFATHLVDWDLSNNTQGWEPSYTVFNPVSQAEKNDPEGNYIRRWVPELKDVEGKAVFAPWERLGEKEFEKLGYPRPHVGLSEGKERCLARFRRDMQGGS